MLLDLTLNDEMGVSGPITSDFGKELDSGKGEAMKKIG
jgi:hypothetical protein